MQYYNDKSNKKAANTMFTVFQIFMMLIVYSFVYISFVAVGVAIEKSSLTFMTYLPEVLTTLVFFLVVLKTRKMFKRGKRLTALGWLVGWASVLIVFLYAHLSQLVPA
jgi:hypothetical protein